MMPTMRHPTAEGTPQIGTPAVARVGEKEDPALKAPGQARPKPGFGMQDGTQDEVVLLDQLAHALLMVPIRAEIEMPLDRYGKKPRRSLNRLMACGMTLFYHTASRVPRGGNGRECAPSPHRP